VGAQKAGVKPIKMREDERQQTEHRQRTRGQKRVVRDYNAGRQGGVIVVIVVISCVLMNA
jgi:hypothetical protein